MIKMIKICYLFVLIYSLFNYASSSSDYIISNEKMIIVNNELERMWKDAVTTYVKIIAQYLPVETKENHKKLYSLGQDLKPGSSKYETGMLTTQPRCSVTI
jgi:hypothetical protein